MCRAGQAVVGMHVVDKSIGIRSCVDVLGAICGSAQSMDLPAQSVDP